MKENKKQTQISTRVDLEFKEQIMQYCKQTDESLSRLIRRLLREEITRAQFGGKDDGTSR